MSMRHANVKMYTLVDNFHFSTIVIESDGWNSHILRDQMDKNELGSLKLIRYSFAGMEKLIRF